MLGTVPGLCFGCGVCRHELSQVCYALQGGRNHLPQCRPIQSMFGVRFVRVGESNGVATDAVVWRLRSLEVSGRLGPRARRREHIRRRTSCTCAVTGRRLEDSKDKRKNGDPATSKQSWGSNEVLKERDHERWIAKGSTRGSARWDLSHAYTPVKLPTSWVGEAISRGQTGAMNYAGANDGRGIRR